MTLFQTDSSSASVWFSLVLIILRSWVRNFTQSYSTLFAISLLRMIVIDSKLPQITWTHTFSIPDSANSLPFPTLGPALFFELVTHSLTISVKTIRIADNSVTHILRANSITYFVSLSHFQFLLGLTLLTRSHTQSLCNSSLSQHR